MKRRSFCAALAALPLLSSPFLRVEGREPIQRPTGPRFKTSLAGYSLRDYFSSMKQKPKQPKTDGKAIDMFGFIDYCVQLGCDGTELTGYFFPPGFDDKYLLDVKRYAFMQGIEISGTSIGNDFTVDSDSELTKQIEEAIEWIHYAALLGAPHIRIFAGTAKQLGDSKEKLSRVCDAVNRCAEISGDLGVVLGIENHGGINSNQLLEIMSRVKSDWVGINLDTGNFVSDDPYAEIEACVPFAVNVQLKPSMRKPSGELYPADLGRVVRILHDGNYRGYVALEYEEESPYQQIPEWFKKLEAAIAEVSH